MGSRGSSRVPFSVWRDSLYSKYNITADIDISRAMATGEIDGSMSVLTSQQRRVIEGKLDALYSEFPQLKSYPISMSYEDTDTIDVKGKGGALGSADIYNHVTLTHAVFNDDRYSNGLRQSWVGGVLQSQFPQGTSASSIVDHEVGHLLTNIATRNSTGDIRNKSDVINAILNRAASRLGDTPSQLTPYISGYATTSGDETISEAVSDYMSNGSSANPYSVEIVRELRRLL